MPQIIIDGQYIEAAPGKTIIEAALDNGITIPHFCWHPALTVAGNCRMCLVQVGSHKKDTDGSLMYDPAGAPVVNWIPKMQIACATPVADGMIVDTVSKKTEETQESIMEFLLINHPLDCPICDEAGECKLQEYAFTHSKGKSRFEEQKNHKDKRVPLGPQVMFDGERCISCSRCIRFADEIAKQPVLTFVRRGDKVTIETFEDTQFDSPYSMNVIEICPVGALTSMDFRFKARVWEMSFTDSICNGCARGCNVKLGAMNNELLRIEPRTNMHVNTYWMCDHGRLATKAKFENDRVSEPMIRQGGTLATATWDDALRHAVTLLQGVKPHEIAVLGSAHASNEDNYALAKFASAVIKTPHVDFIRHNDPSFGDEILKVNDVAANGIGAHTVGIHPATGGATSDQLATKITSGGIKALIVLADDLSTQSVQLAEAAASLDALIVIATNVSTTSHMAHVVLPLAAIAESEGTLTNTMHRVQHFEAALVTKENERTMGMKMSRWDKFGAPNDRWTHGDRRNSRSGWRIVQLLANAMGAHWTYASSKAVFNDIAGHVSMFNGMSYELLDQYQGLVLGKAAIPEPTGAIYESHVLKPN